jgi:MscS family membrane protein
LLLQGGQHLGIPLSSLLAGAGVAGAALALSAQDVLKNVFGSIMLIMDKPFVVGERIKVKQYDGVVEEVSLRSTKVRLLNGHQAIIPNEDMARTDIENIGRRPFIRRVTKIPLSVDISPAKAKKAVEILQGLLKDHEGFNPDFPPRIWLNDFERDHLELKMIYWYHPPEYWKYTEYADRLNRQILDAFDSEGIAIALPSFVTRAEGFSELPRLPLPAVQESRE